MGEEVGVKHTRRVRFIEFCIVLVFFVLMFFIAYSYFGWNINLSFGNKITGHDISYDEGFVASDGPSLSIDVCDGIDNNLDGTVDEGCGCVGVHAKSFCSQFNIDNSSNLAEHPGATDSCVANGCVAHEGWCFGADINKDGIVNMTDYDIIHSRVYDSDCSFSNSWCDGADLNMDGSVSYEEQALVGSSLGQENCGSPRRISLGCSFESTCNGNTKDLCSNPACVWDKVDLGSCDNVFLNATWNLTSGLNASGAFDFIGDSKVPNAANYMNITQINGDYAMSSRGDLYTHRYERAVSKIFNPPRSSWGGRVYVNFNQSVLNLGTPDIVFAGAYTSTAGWYDSDWTRDFALAITRNYGLNKTSYLYTLGYQHGDFPCVGCGFPLFTQEEGLPNRWIEIDWMFSNNRIYSRVDNRSWEPGSYSYLYTPSAPLNFSRFSLGWISSYSGGTVYFKSVELYNSSCAFDWMKYNSSSMHIICVDNDNDGYNSTGFSCGPVDCDDSNSNIRYSLSGNCFVQDPSDMDNDGYVSVAYGGNDCNDNDSAIHPGAIDICDNLDNDCNGVVDNITSTAGCSFSGICVGSHKTCTGGVWSSCSILPQQEICDGIDQDCDGNVWFFNSSMISCSLGYRGACSPEFTKLCISNLTNSIDSCPRGLDSECNNFDDCSEAKCVNNSCVYTKIENLTDCYHCVNTTDQCFNGLCRGLDINHNGLVDNGDMNVIKKYFGSSCDISNFFCEYADVDGYNDVGSGDFGLLKDSFGTICKVRQWKLSNEGNSSNNNSNNDSSPAIVVSEGGGGSGGSGGGGGLIVKSSILFINETEFSLGVEKDFGVGDVIVFDIVNDFGVGDVKEEHSIKVNNVYDNRVDIVLRSDPQFATLTLGEARKFELDGDGYYDVRVILNSIENKKVNISVKKIAEDILTGSGPIEPSLNNESAIVSYNPEKLFVSRYVWIALIGSILLMIILIIWALKVISNHRVSISER